MKKIHLYIAAAAIASLTASCADERYDVQGEGSLALSASVSADMTQVSRATDEDLAASCYIWISNDKGLVREFALADVPGKIALATGRYTAEAWAGDSVSASFEKRYFYGNEVFDVTAGTTTPVQLICKIQNTAVSVDYSQAAGIETYLKDITMTVGHKKGSLIYEGTDDDRRGYFMMPSYSPDLEYELTATQINGAPFSFKGTIEAAQRGIEYVLHVKYQEKSSEVGGAIFSIAIDRHEIDVETTVPLVAAPKIEGYGFNLCTPIVGEQGTIGRRSIYITSATEIKAVEISSDIFASTSLGRSTFELLGSTADGVNALAAAGVNFNNQYDTENGTLLKLNFEAELLNSLANGEYVVSISATDVKGQTSDASLSISVSEVPGMTLPYVEPLEAVYTTAVLRGIVSKDNVEEIGFKYAEAGTNSWTYVDGTVGSRAYAAGTEYYAELTGLTAGATYKYRAVIDKMESPIEYTFSTTAYPQLPNNSFEDWNDSGKVTYVSASTSDFYWDSGNHGSATVGKNITSYDSSLKHSGKYSAKFETASIVGVIAAGNIFTGQFFGTENGTKGIVGFGRPFNFVALPTALSVWVKYSPAELNSSASKAPASAGVSKGDLDKGIIYVALMDDTHMTYNGYSAPVISRTADIDNWTMRRDLPNVIAYGEKLFTEATPGSGLVNIIIPIEYSKPGTPSNIAVVATSSFYGDYYCGGPGSTMWIDDVELIY